MTQTTLPRAALETRIDEFLARQIDPALTELPLKTFVPTPSWNRFDLGFKLLWLDGRRTGGSPFADRLYEDHIAAFSLGDMIEPGSDGKAGITRFRDDFEALMASMERGGFDPKRSLVPLALDGSLLNAGHRAACAIALGETVTAVETGLEPKIFDYRFFAGRGMDAADLDAAAIRMVEAMPHAAVALLWPAAKGREREVEQAIGPLIYRRALQISLKAGHTLLSRVYPNEPWLGPAEDNFPGIRRKLMECFSGPGPLRVLIFDAPPERDRVALKDEIRALYKIAKSSVHITDTHAEAVELAHLLLNPNARHFLEYGEPMAFPETRRHLETLAHWRDTRGLAPEAFAVDTGMVMGLYGLRPPSDIDVISAAPLPEAPAGSAIERHDGGHHSAPPAEILRDPALHFRYAGLSFVSLPEVAALKTHRLAGQDREDLLRIEPLLAAQNTGAPRRPGALRARFALLRLRRSVIRALMGTGLGQPLRRVYRKTLRRG
ncbi:hypothetical protein [Thioclava pacifica]|uniref:Uncharacterized protein n=1 Tax=Thioclava pacifica DSM 10166 TaxID=1353537 RepID=A0A074JNA5_9RHOB|nr:hypothetical protein [Thioclava pacifica]KEO50862.1 hypothetical protein TP2_13320 [Thioclava pacifica DSM 10166]